MKVLCTLIESIDMDSTLRNSVASGYDNVFVPDGIGGSGLFIINKKNNSILLGKRAAPDEFADHWCTFGGTVEKGEHPMNTATREVWEEGKIDSSNLNMHVPHLYIDETNSGFKFITYIATCNDEFDVSVNKEHSDYGWFPITKLPTPMHPGVNRMMANPTCMRRIMDTITR